VKGPQGLSWPGRARAETKRRSRWPILLALITTLAVAHGAPAHKHHHPGCNTDACDRRIDRWLKHWEETHRPRFVFGAFELCVANRESGEPGSTSFGTIRWDYVGGGYEGAYNWVNSTWIAEGGGRYAAHANEASPEQQTLIFRAHANARDWPVTVPACGG
jgi:hypothetical protein